MFKSNAVPFSKHVAVFVLVLPCLPLFVSAQSDEDYTAEIMRHIIDPCFEYKAKNAEPIEGLTEENMMMLLKLDASQHVLQTINVTLPIVRDKPEDARMGIYKSGRELCIEAAEGGS